MMGKGFGLVARQSAAAAALSSMSLCLSSCASGSVGNQSMSTVHSQAAQSTTAAGAWCSSYSGDNPTTETFVAQVRELADRVRDAAGAGGAAPASSDDNFVDKYTVARGAARSAVDFLRQSPIRSSEMFTKWYCAAPDARQYQVSGADAGGANMNKVMTESAVYPLSQGLLNGCVYTEGAKNASDPVQRDKLLTQGDDGTRHFREVAVSYLCPELR